MPLTFACEVELDLLFDQISRDDSIRVVIITGEGRGFQRGRRSANGSCASGSFGRRERFWRVRSLQRAGELLFQRPSARRDPKGDQKARSSTGRDDCSDQWCGSRYRPRIGNSLRHALRLGQGAPGRGRGPGRFRAESGGARNLPKLVGVGRAMEMILTGAIIDAAEAQRIGLVERVFPHDKLIAEVLEIAERIAAAPFLSVRHAKSLVRRYWDHNRSDEGARAELDAVMEITRTQDCREGIRAFLDKRSPQYRGPSYGR